MFGVVLCAVIGSVLQRECCGLRAKALREQIRSSWVLH